jgi:peptidoglycan hydrolase-like protein with peptidoglycan-binding domain
MPLPLIPIAAAAALGGGLWYISSHKKPVLQSVKGSTHPAIDTVSALPPATPIQVVIPTSPNPPVISVAATPLHPNNTGSGASYSPPPVVLSSKPGFIQMAPTLISPAGAASMSVQTSQDIQNALNTLGYGPLAVDGKIGPSSVAAIKSFQTKNRLNVDGVAGQNTKKQLQDAIATVAGFASNVGAAPVVLSADPTTPAKVAVVTGTPIAVNTTKDVQHTLNLLGASPVLTEDGKQGPMTTAAVKAFQVSHGLVSDGVAGPKTKTALVLALSPAIAGSSTVGFGQDPLLDVITGQMLDQNPTAGSDFSGGQKKSNRKFG